MNENMTKREWLGRAIAGLYNNAKPLGMGYFHFRAGKLSVEDAQALANHCLHNGVLYLDYFRGRLMKTEFHAERQWIDFDLYDRDYGPGAGASALLDGLTDPFYNSDSW